MTNQNHNKVISITSYKDRPFFTCLIATICILYKDWLSVLRNFGITGSYGILVLSVLLLTIFVVSRFFRIKECINLNGNFLVIELHRYRGSIKIDCINSISLIEDANNLCIETDESTQTHRLANFRRKKVEELIARINQIITER